MLGLSCNEAARRIAFNQLRDDWSEIKILWRCPAGMQNIGPLGSLRFDPQRNSKTGKTAPAGGRSFKPSDRRCRMLGSTPGWPQDYWRIRMCAFDELARRDLQKAVSLG